MSAKAFTILLIEDSPSDIFLTREALQLTRKEQEIHVVHDGVEALAFLRHEGQFCEAPRPDLILLDLNMPRKDGRELLAEIKSDENLLSIPVIVLTSSNAEQDLRTAYSLHANCYIAKPADFERFKEVIQAIDNFWFLHVALPPSP